MSSSGDVTDYDCWHEDEADVSGEAVMEVIQQNVKTAQDVVRRIIRQLPIERACGCGDALKMSLITERSRIPQQTLKDLEPIVGRYYRDEANVGNDGDHQS